MRATVRKRPRYSAPALEKGLDIIEYLSRRDEGENLTSISSGIGKSNSEIFRMLSVLEQRGFVDRLPESDRYLLSDKLFQLGLSRPRKKDLMKLAIPAMEEFARECQNACHLSIRAGNDIVVVSRVESPVNVGIAVRVGHRLPMARAPRGDASPHSRGPTKSKRFWARSGSPTGPGRRRSFGPRSRRFSASGTVS